MLRLAILWAVLSVSIDACSNIIVTSGASQDSSNIVAYNADSAALYGSLYHYPTANHASGDKRQIYDWDGGFYRGEIEEAPHTYNVVGNINEKGLIIGETTYGGISVLQSQKDAILDYGSLIWITLQRSASAREAITTMGKLVATYGYGSEGESFSIADQKEAWVMEIIGKGDYELGAVWVARKIPDGAVCAHANQARITTFPLDDPENTLYAPDVISFAKKIGLVDPSLSDAAFSFSDTYDPVTFSGARFCEARVWSFFGAIMGSAWSEAYENYALGYNLTNRMPLWVVPQEGGKISAADTMKYMRNHYENTDLDMAGQAFADVGAGDSYTPYRAHPLTWQSEISPVTGEPTADGRKFDYLHERPIATPQTGWNFVAQSRRWMPEPFGALLWFGVDDSSTTAHFPIHGGATRVPATYAGKGTQDGVTPPMMEFNLQSAFYSFNLVANFVYSKWNLAYPDLLSEILAKEEEFFNTMTNVDANVNRMLEAGKSISDAVEYATQQSEDMGNKLVNYWSTTVLGKIFVKFRDGYVITSNPESTSCGCDIKSANYPQDWYDRIVKDTHAHYLVGTPNPEAKAKFASTDKLALLSRR